MTEDDRKRTRAEIEKLMETVAADGGDVAGEMTAFMAIAVVGAFADGYRDGRLAERNGDPDILADLQPPPTPTPITKH